VKKRELNLKGSNGMSVDIGSSGSGENEPDSFVQDLIKHFSGLSKDVLIYGFGGTLGRVLSLFTAPILTRIFSVADYGVVELVSTTVGFFTMLLGFNLTSGMWRYYYEISQENIAERKCLVSSTYWLIMGISIPMTIVIALMADHLSIYLFDSPGYTSIIRLAVFSIPLRMFHTLFIGMQRMRRRPVRYTALNLGNVLLNFGLIVLFVIVLRLGIRGIFMAQLIAYTGTMVMGMWMGRDLLALAFSLSWLKKIAAYALPALPAVFINWFLAMGNRFFLNSYAGATQLGYLSVANKVAMVVVLFTSAFRLAWDPFALSIINGKNFRRIYARGLDYYLAVMLLVGAGVTVLAREALMVIAPAAYWPAASLVGILVARHVLQGANNIVGISIAVSKRTIFTSIALAIAAAVNVLANLTLTARLGASGAALSEMIGFLAGFVSYYFIARHVFPIPWNLRNVFKLLGGFALLVLLSLYLETVNLSWGWKLLPKLALLGGYAGLAWSSFSTEERRVARRIPKHMLAWGRSHH